MECFEDKVTQDAYEIINKIFPTIENSLSPNELLIFIKAFIAGIEFSNSQMNEKINNLISQRDKGVLLLEQWIPKIRGSVLRRDTVAYLFEVVKSKKEEGVDILE